MRGRWNFWVVVGLLPVFHFLLHVGFGAAGWAPDLLAVALLLAARELAMGTSAAVGCSLGLLEDAFSALAFGANAVALTLVGILGARSRDLFMGDSMVFFVFYIAAGKWLKDLVHWLASPDEVRGVPARTLLVEAPVAAVYAALVGAALVFVFGDSKDATR